MTNFEFIHDMNEEELAKFLYEVQNEYFGMVINSWLNWLKEEAKFVLCEQEDEE